METTTKPDTRSIFSTTINLLPPEILAQRKQSFKISLLNKLSILALLALIFFTAITLALRVMQSFTLKSSEEGLVKAEEKVTALQGKEGQILILKQRLNVISNLMGADNKRKAIFNLIVFLTPAQMQITEGSVDKSGNMSLSLISPSLSILESFLADLASPQKNLNMISKVDMEGLSLGKDSNYRFSLKIVPK